MRWPIMLVLVGGVSTAFAASLFAPARDALVTGDGEAAGFIQQLCLSSIDYSLVATADLYNGELREGENIDRRFAAVKEDYHHRMGCLLDDAFATSADTVLRSAEDTLRQQTGDSTMATLPREKIVCELRGGQFINDGCTPPPPPADGEKTCENISIGGVIASQRQVRESLLNSEDSTETTPPDTACDPNGTHPTVAEEYSACRVAEALTAEHCGYSLWLTLGSMDEAQAVAQIRYVTELEKDSLAQRAATENILLTALSEIRQRNEKEIADSRRTMEESLAFYGHFRDTFRTHVAVSAVRAALRGSINETATWCRQMETLPEQLKFQMRESCT